MNSDNQLLFVVAAVCVVILGSIGLAAAYPFSMDTQADAHWTYGSSESTHEITSGVTVHMEGDQQMLESTFIADESTVYEQHHIDGETTTTVSHYTETTDDWRLTRMETSDSDQYDGWVDEYTDTLVHHDSTDGTHVVTRAAEYSEDRTIHTHLFPVGTTQFLSTPTYEEQGAETYADREVTVYEPQEGWYEQPDDPSQRPFRLTDADGSLYVDTETGELVYADVSYTLTDGANYIDYLNEKWRGDGPTRIDVWYALDEDDVTFAEPDWTDLDE